MYCQSVRTLTEMAVSLLPDSKKIKRGPIFILLLQIGVHVYFYFVGVGLKVTIGPWALQKIWSFCAKYEVWLYNYAI